MENIYGMIYYDLAAKIKEMEQNLLAEYEKLTIIVESGCIEHAKNCTLGVRKTQDALMNAYRRAFELDNEDNQ